MPRSFSRRAGRFPIKICLSLTFIAVLAAANFERFPFAAAAIPAADGSTPCACTHIKAIQAELRNALKLQQAFRNKIADLRQKNEPSSNNALKIFAEGEARQGLEKVPDYDGPLEVDYHNNSSSLSDPLHPGNTFNAKQLCQMTDSATDTLNRAVAASACAGIGAALRAHEAFHEKSCLAQGSVSYSVMHGADRAQEEVEAYGVQIKALREILAGLVCGYRATGQTADTCSGAIRSLKTVYRHRHQPSNDLSISCSIPCLRLMARSASRQRHRYQSRRPDRARIRSREAHRKVSILS